MTDINSGDHPQPTTRRSMAIALPIAGLIVLVAILWWGFGESLPYGSKTPDLPVIVAPAEPSPEVEVVPEQTSPVEPEPEQEPEPEFVPELPAPPTLSEANGQLSSGLWTFSPSPLAATFISAPNLIERLVAIIDNLRQGFVPYKLLPVGRPEASFSFIDDGLAVTINPKSFDRYDGLAQLISDIDTDALVGAYTAFEVAANEAWDILGYETPKLKPAVLVALEAIMLAPETVLDARLYKVEANWVYEDPALEALSPLEKQLMRMGPTNSERVKEKAREIRGALLDR